MSNSQVRGVKFSSWQSGQWRGQGRWVVLVAIINVFVDYVGGKILVKLDTKTSQPSASLKLREIICWADDLGSGEISITVLVGSSGSGNIILLTFPKYQDILR